MKTGRDFQDLSCNLETTESRALTLQLPTVCQTYCYDLQQQFNPPFPVTSITIGF